MFPEPNLARHEQVSSLLSAFSLLPSAAAPPPELTVLRQQYEGRVAEQVTATFEAQVAELNGRFTGALDNAIARAKSAGDLATVLALQEDKERVANAQPIPEDAESTPEPVKNLRAIYRTQLAKLEEQRAANHAALLAPYTVRLKDLEATLTKVDRVEEARQVMEYREGLAGSAPAPRLPVVETSAEAPSKLPPAGSGPNPAGDDRKAAEWALDMNPMWLVFKTGQGEVTIRGVGQLPSEPFQILRLGFNHQSGIGPPRKPYKGLDILAGLPSLEVLHLVNMPIRDEDFEVFATLPALNSLLIKQNKARMTGGKIGLLEALPELRSLTLEDCAIDSKGVAGIGKLVNLTNLLLDNNAVTDKDLPNLAKLEALRELDLSRNRVTASGLAQLASLRQVVALGWTPTPRKARAELQQVAAAFPGVTMFRLIGSGRYAADDIAGLSAFPALSKLFVEGELCNAETFAGAASLPGLTELRCYATSQITEEAFAALKATKSLQYFNADAGHRINAACLQHLAAIPTLKKVALTRCPDLKPADIEAFKKSRPDIQVMQ